jgi:hypothetical protein
MNELVNSPLGGEAVGATSSGWRNVFKVHPACALFPAMSPDQLRALGEDIKANELQETIKYVQYNRRTKQYNGFSDDDDNDIDLILIDGRNRLDAMELVGERVPTTLDEFNKFSKSENLWAENDEQIVRYIISANIRRRHLSGKDQDRIIGELLKLDPYKSDRQIGRETNVDHKKVGAVRHRLEDVGEIPHVERRTDSQGRQQPAHKPERQRPPTQMNTGNIGAKPNAPRNAETTRKARQTVEMLGIQPAPVPSEPTPEPAPAPKPSTPAPVQSDFFKKPAVAMPAPQSQQALDDQEKWRKQFDAYSTLARDLISTWGRDFPGW